MSIKNLLVGADPSRRLKQLETLVEKQAKMIERLRASKVSIPAGRKRPNANQSYLRVLVPDTHGAHIDKQAASVFLRDLEALNPAEVILMGDHVDCGGFLAQHHVLGTVPETEVTFEQDVVAANELLDRIQVAAPKSVAQYLEGNHEARIEKFVCKMVLGNHANASYLRRMFGPEIVLGLEKRGIRFIKRTGQYDGLSVRGTIDLGQCLARHGKKCGVHAAHATLSQFGCNVVFAHTHRIAMASKETSKGLAAAWSFGCLCELKPLYYDTDTTDWGHGYGIQVVVPKKGFLTLQVPIIDGVSYLFPLLQRLNLK